MSVAAAAAATPVHLLHHLLSHTHLSLCLTPALTDRIPTLRGPFETTTTTAPVRVPLLLDRLAAIDQSL